MDAKGIRAFGDRITSLVSRLENARLETWFDDRDGFGSMRLSDVSIPTDCSVMLCGPLPFMKAIMNQTRELNLSASRVSYEVFGPDSWLAH
ncbi:hypothetical protein GCM10027406_05840 [Leifsonia lichenia]